MRRMLHQSVIALKPEWLGGEASRGCRLAKNPKSDTRNPKEVRSPKSERVGLGEMDQPASAYMGSRNSDFGFRTSFGFRPRAFSLIEIMVAVTLLSMIVIGLLAVFNHMQRAMRAVSNQTDIFEGARAVVEMVSRDVSGINTPSQPGVLNIHAADAATHVMARPGGGYQTNVLQDIFFLSRENDTWAALGYFLDQKTAGVGTLYRFSTNGYWYSAGSNFTARYFDRWWQAYLNTGLTNSHRVVDGVVHFQAYAYDERGHLYTPGWETFARTNVLVDTNYYVELTTNITVAPDGFEFRGRFIPAYLELEIGLLEPEVTRQFNSIAASDSAAAQNFLAGQLGRIHMFRQRIPVRNHIKPEAFY